MTDSTSSEKIPCSVGIRTLNSAATLERCLDSVTEFADIVICDGNSTDSTREIAQRYGCTVVKQYDTDEPNVSSANDQATVMNRALDASRYDWHVYLDSDDALTAEVVAEIRAVVANPQPPFLVYAMPLLFKREDGPLILHSSNYPYLQNRLFNKKTGARFHGAVHGRPVFDRTRYPIGRLAHPYIVYLSGRDIHNALHNQCRYARIEAQVYTPQPWRQFLVQGVWLRIRSIARVVLLSLRNYLFFGFANSMPVQFEYARLRYQLLLLWLIIKKQLA